MSKENQTSPTSQAVKYQKNLLKRGLCASQLTEILGNLLKSPIDLAITINYINTDTRIIKKGQTFVALSGENFDGHQFIDTAIELGATVLLVERQQLCHTPQIVVSDTRLALGKIAGAIRDDFVKRGGRIVGLTGSVGKTTNKQMLASILSQVGGTHFTRGNLNNELGVPFTWFNLNERAHFAVIEMGANHQNEIDYLARITRPQVAMITNAGEAHLEGFVNIEGVAKGKGELFTHLKIGDTAVINADDSYADYWRGLLGEGVLLKTFSLTNSSADIYASNIKDKGAHFTLHFNGNNGCNEGIEINLPTAGQHNVMNALGCAMCALSMGASSENIVRGLSTFTNAKGRLQTITLGSLTVIDDTYNANPMSMRASANVLNSSDGYRIMVVGDMGELGENTRELHAQLGKDLVDKAELFFCLGDNMRDFADHNNKAKHFADIDALNSELRTRIEKEVHATILVKGSFSMQMKRVVTFLQNYSPEN